MSQTGLAGLGTKLDLGVDLEPDQPLLTIKNFTQVGHRLDQVLVVVEDGLVNRRQQPASLYLHQTAMEQPVLSP
jgi:hypothetical protein